MEEKYPCGTLFRWKKYDDDDTRFVAVDGSNGVCMLCFDVAVNLTNPESTYRFAGQIERDKWMDQMLDWGYISILPLEENVVIKQKRVAVKK